MAQPIQNPGVGVALQRYFNLVGRVRPQLEEFVIPTVSVGDLAGGGPPAVSASAQSRLVVAAGGAGQLANIRFDVPGGIVAVVKKVNFRAGAASTILGRPGSTFAAPATAGTARLTDGRLLEQGVTSPACNIFGGTSAAGVAGHTWRLPFDPAVESSVIYEPDWVIGSGRAGQFGFFEWSLDVANTELQMVLEWIEYPVV